MSRHTIVVGVDGSPHSDEALRWSVGHSNRLGGQGVAVFAWQLPFAGIPGAYNRDELERAAKAFITGRVSEVVPSPPVPVLPVVAEGDPAEALAAAAGNADLLVLGVRGRSPFIGLMLGSVSQRCSMIARCPVVLVKPPADEGEGGGGREGEGGGGREGGGGGQPGPAPVATGRDGSVTQSDQDPM